NGKDVIDRPRLGFTVVKEPPKRQYVNFVINSAQEPAVFAIPPNSPNWQAPISEATFLEDVDLVWAMAHMHVRGKDMTYKLTYPDGRTETILSIQNYDYNWQLGYQFKPIRLPKGTKLTVIADYDNSPNNRANPDPNRTVYWGDQAWEEMMSPFFAVIAGRNIDAKKILITPTAARPGA
ncbi:MAG: thiol-disulfide isomerase, partial [Acidobacteria bacterium]